MKKLLNIPILQLAWVTTNKILLFFISSLFIIYSGFGQTNNLMSIWHQNDSVMFNATRLQLSAVELNEKQCNSN